MQIFELDLSMRKMPDMLYAKQRDVGLKICVVLTDNQEEYNIPNGTQFSVWFTGKSGSGNYTEIDGRSAFRIDGNKVTVELIYQMLTNPGEHVMCLVMNGADGNQQGLWNIPYFVEAIPGADSEAATAYYPAFLEAQKKAEDAAAQSEAAAGRAEAAAEKIQLDQEYFDTVVFSVDQSAEIAAAAARDAAKSEQNIKGDAERAEGAAEASKNAAVSAEASNAEAKEQANRAEYLVKGLEGVFVLQKGEGEDSIVQISTTGTDNKSYAPAGTALGMNAVSGIKGFHMVSVDTENLLITVDDAELEEKAAKVYAEGDVLQFDAKGHNYFKLEIVRLATNDEGHSVIGVKKTTEETLNLTLAADPKENYCWVVGKNYGEIFTMARAAHTEGESAISAGRAAHAEGRQTRAIGAYAHAEGRETVANYAAHAEGESTTASGRFSHAEGDNTKAVGEASHAEGQLTQAIGDHAHAEGQSTKAKGMYSHAEGVYTATKGFCSHGEGVGTIATGSGQHVQGRYNIEDTGSKYAHIVGGGNSDTDRKNIHTIDWQGNAEFAGDHITVGGKTLTAATIKLLEGLTVSEGVAF